MLLALTSGRRGFYASFFFLSSVHLLGLKILNLVTGRGGNMVICRLDGLGIALGKTVVLQNKFLHFVT